MAFDLVIRGASLIDGTGAPARTGDVGVKDGLIAEVGGKLGPGAREIKADGAALTPGFVDIHTHYDGQVSWDADLAPSCFHGVTTAVMGSCGVGFAPVRPSERDALVRVFEGVEDIPGTALHEGMPWTWESYPDYLDAIDSFPHAIDFASHLTHDALRLYVMGERALAHEKPREAEIEEMTRLTHEAVAAGAVGVSTGRTAIHVTADGKMTPGYMAERAELLALARGLKGLDHGVMQVVSDFAGEEEGVISPGEWDNLQSMVAESGGHGLSVSLVQGMQHPEVWRDVVEMIDGAQKNGLDIRFQAGVRGVGVLMGLQTTIHPILNRPGYRAMMDRPLAEQVARLQDPGLKARLLAEPGVKVAGEGTGLPEGVDEMLANLDDIADLLYAFEPYPDYEPGPEKSFGARARARQERPLSVLYDYMLEDDGRALIYFPIFNYAQGSLEPVREMLSHPASLVGLSDGGAHVATICDASYSTTLLGHWVRDRARGERLPLEKMVRKLTHEIAGFLGFHDRGLIAPGRKADLNLIDLGAVRARRPHIEYDLPAGGPRFIQKADGYLATLVSGETVVENGRLTGARPGRLKRAGR